VKQVFQFVIFVLFLLLLGDVRVETLRRPSMVVYLEFFFSFYLFTFPLDHIHMANNGELVGQERRNLHA